MKYMDSAKKNWVSRLISPNQLIALFPVLRYKCGFNSSYPHQMSHCCYRWGFILYLDIYYQLLATTLWVE